MTGERQGNVGTGADNSVLLCARTTQTNKTDLFRRGCWSDFGAGGEGISAGYDLYFVPGRVCGELPVLFDGEAGDQAGFDGGGDCGAGGGGGGAAWAD